MSNYRLAILNHQWHQFKKKKKKSDRKKETQRKDKEKKKNERRTNTAGTHRAVLSEKHTCSVRRQLRRRGAARTEQNACCWFHLALLPSLHSYIYVSTARRYIITRGIVRAAPWWWWRRHTPRPYATQNYRHRRLIVR